MEEPKKELPSAYVAADHETSLYKLWEESGFFNPDNLPGERTEAFSMVMPPPNVTGTLHLGHAFEHTLQDIAVRFHRMRGKRTLWIPGTDHAAIATQSRYEKELSKKEGKSRHDFSREDFFKQVNDFAFTNQVQILEQIKRMGDSCDWSRLAFTLDEKRERAVRTAFKRMYDDGLIYRRERVVNWDPKGQTTISDDEVVHEEADAVLYTFRYSKDFPIAIATTRPETKLGDTAVAVHPVDARYKQFVGKTFVVDFCGTKLGIKIIAESSVDPEFGTGALGVTPAHSMVDWELSERHELPLKQVINEYAKMVNVPTEFEGKKTLEARTMVVEWLKANGLLEKEDKIKNNISKAERTGGVIEPLPKLQWFIDIDKPFTKDNKETTLQKIMLEAVDGGSVTIAPERFDKIYHHWVKNLRDWCISRQILYGHRIPVWYKGEEVYCGIEAPTGDGWTQDADTLDTWFSSGLWTFSTLGWPDETEDLKKFHPTSFINPGYEILPLWVSRMIMFSGYLLGEPPFKKAYFHGIVRAKDGRKFSKSLNNGIDPLEVIAKYGTDALRMALVVGTAPGNDVSYDDSKVGGYRNFANKIWNASRFVVMNLDAGQTIESILSSKPTLSDGSKTVLAELATTIEDVTKNLEAFDFNHAGDALYHYFWHTFADKIIEMAKEPLLRQGSEGRSEAQYVIVKILTTCLKALHPFMPFVTEAVWQDVLPRESKGLLMVESWPSQGVIPAKAGT